MVGKLRIYLFFFFWMCRGWLKYKELVGYRMRKKRYESEKVFYFSVLFVLPLSNCCVNKTINKQLSQSKESVV